MKTKWHWLIFYCFNFLNCKKYGITTQKICGIRYQWHDAAVPMSYFSLEFSAGLYLNEKSCLHLDSRWELEFLLVLVGHTLPTPGLQ